MLIDIISLESNKIAWFYCFLFVENRLCTSTLLCMTSHVLGCLNLPQKVRTMFSSSVQAYSEVFVIRDERSGFWDQNQ